MSSIRPCELEGAASGSTSLTLGNSAGAACAPNCWRQPLPGADSPDPRFSP